RPGIVLHREFRRVRAISHDPYLAATEQNAVAARIEARGPDDVRDVVHERGRAKVRDLLRAPDGMIEVWFDRRVPHQEVSWQCAGVLQDDPVCSPVPLHKPWITQSLVGWNV